MIKISINLVKWIFIAIAVIYFLVPTDLLPDFLGIIGRLDDLVIILLLYWRYKKTIANYYHSGNSSNSQQTSGSTNASVKSALNPYQILNLEPGASQTEIKKQYLKLASQYHPDKVEHLGDDLKAVAKEKMIEIQKAYEALSNQ